MIKDGGNTQPKSVKVWIALLLPSLILSLVAFVSVVENRAKENVMNPSGGPTALAWISDSFRQGWGFFTRDARENRNRLYIQQEEGWQLVEEDTSVRVQNLFGLKRGHRAFMADVGFIVEHISKAFGADVEEDNEQFSTGWNDCKFDSDGVNLDQCVQDTEPIEIPFTPYFQQFCNQPLIITSERVIPYSYARLTQQRETKALLIEIICREEM